MDMYRYQDLNNYMLDKLIDYINTSNEDKHWDEDEESIFKLFFEMTEGSYSLLDAGCGDGRLIGKYKDHFKEITVLERDKSNAKKIINLINYFNIKEKVKLQLGKIQDLEENKKFDVIICSHVLQHISITDCEDVVKKFSRIVKPKGLLFILVSHSETPRDIFTKISRNKDKIKEKEITVDEFNYLTEVCGEVPVRKFTKESIQNLAEKYDFQTLKYGVYHMINRERPFNKTNPNKMENTPRLVALDSYLIAQRL
ncbi:MAG: class I SAM-dependent methyltransferase [Clostridia bacterium]|nr:class I SAM-dependent methyltransferase [Clostridia bacterium]